MALHGVYHAIPTVIMSDSVSILILQSQKQKFRDAQQLAQEPAWRPGSHSSWPAALFHFHPTAQQKTTSNFKEIILNRMFHNM
jgi:hypothetical protein